MGQVLKCGIYSLSEASLFSVAIFQMSRLLTLAMLMLYIQLVGCNQGPIADQSQGDSFVQLRAIHQAYIEFSDATGKAPESAQDLERILMKANQDPETIFVSASDGQPFVIHWGAQPLTATTEPTVIAYESSGKNKQRMVMTSMGIMAMSEHELSNARFPAGFSPPTTSD